MSNFKAYDLVYYPTMGTQVFQLDECRGRDCLPICIRLDGDEGDFVAFTSTGFVHSTDQLPKIFHATEDNHALLEELYGKEFQKPPTKPTSRDIIRAMLERGDKCVPCYVSDVFDNPFHIHEWTFICTVAYSRFLANNKESYKYATPFDPKTGQPITEMPE